MYYIQNVSVIPGVLYVFWSKTDAKIWIYFYFKEIDYLKEREYLMSF